MEWQGKGWLSKTTERTVAVGAHCQAGMMLCRGTKPVPIGHLTERDPGKAIMQHGRFPSPHCPLQQNDLSTSFALHH